MVLPQIIPKGLKNNTRLCPGLYWCCKDDFQEDVELRVIGNSNSPMFPWTYCPIPGEKPLARRYQGKLPGQLRLALGLTQPIQSQEQNHLQNYICSNDVSRIDLIIRWGGRRRLSGFLPVQSIYSDFYVINDYWPDFKEEHLYEALEWYNQQDITLGG